MSRQLPSLNALRAFEAAARLESVSRAADELHVTHGAVSRQIRALETDLGRPLFTRQGRGLALTATGMRLRDAAGTAFARLQEAYAELRRDDGPAALVLGCPGSVLARWVIPRLERLGRELPSVKLHLSAHEGAFDTQLPGLDAALMLAEPPWPAQWQVHELAPEYIGPVVSPRYAGYAKLQDRPVQALLGETLLHTASRPQAWPSWATHNDLDPAALRLGTGFDHLYYLLEAAVAGMGVAIAPQPLVSEDIASGRLAAPWGFTLTTGTWVLCAPQRNTDTRVAELAEWLRSELATAS
ncbi:MULTISPECIES: LysR family transcriptional regulator [unclassified Pseudoxanthomonas]|jgi:DNA-binding transcriptional LysR family regulator|uniref:LysR family transcriptional regulator n=1 Tax=unclassified Pseudoxanthomonas TaxID=2645906 RepID=UPI0030774663